MAQVSFNIRMDENTKKEADILFKEMGFTMTSAINVFIKQALFEQGMPFQITRKTVLSDKLAKLPQLGYQNNEGNYVLPSEYDVPEDNIYDEL